MPLVLEERRSIAELRELYRDLHSFGKDLRDVSLRFQDLVRHGAFPERGRTYSYASDDPRDVLNRSIDITRDFAFLVAVTGAFSSGKSTLLNLLLDQPDLLPASVIPMTAVCTVIRYGEQPRVNVRYVPFQETFERARMCVGQPFKAPFTGPEHIADAAEHPERFVEDPSAQESLRRFTTLLRRYDEILDPPVAFAGRAPFISGGGILPDGGGSYRYFTPTPSEEKQYHASGGDPARWVTREWLALIRDVELWIPSPLLENDIVFLDLPGLNCREDYHRRAIQQYCNMADCILVAAFQPGNQADAEVIANFKKLSSNFHNKIFFALNKVDQFAQEPEELVRAVDYLARDTIGGDFPRNRFFLTSAHLSRAYRTGDPTWRHDHDRLQNALAKVSTTLPGIEEWVEQVSNVEDPGGVGHLKARLYSFLLEDAYPTKVAEILRNHDLVVDGIRDAASPTFDETQNMDATDILRRSVLDYFRHVEELQHNAIYRFRYEYLRGNESESGSVLRDDLHRILDAVHRRVQSTVRGYFDRPILTTPLHEDPVGEFDLLIIADEAAGNLRKQLQDVVIRAIHEPIYKVLESYLRQGEFKEHLQNMFRGAPEHVRRQESVLAHFEEIMLHSIKGIVRTGFFHMPRGRDLKRLERNVSLAQMKDLLVEVFSDFYPSWIYENVYGAVIDRLWLSLFLDSEDLEDELSAFFRASESVITGIHVAEQVEIPDSVMENSRDLYQSVRMCREIEKLLQRRSALHSKAADIGVRP